MFIWKLRITNTASSPEDLLKQTMVNNKQKYIIYGYKASS